MEQRRHTNQKFRVIAVISAIAVCICVGAAVLLRTVILPGRNYRAALELYRSGDLDGAIRYGGHSITDTFTCVRPALWLNLEPAEAAAGMDTASSTEN